MKHVLIVGASAYHAWILEDLREAGHALTLIDRDPDHPLRAMVDNFVGSDFSDAHVMRGVLDSRPDAVLALNDVAVRALAAADPFRYDPESARRGSEKLLMRNSWKKHGLPQPDFRAYDQEMTEPDTPFVVKPSFSGGGGRGVSIVAEPQEFASAVEHAVDFALTEEVLVEDYVSGVEFTVEVLSWRDAHAILGISSKTKVPDRPWIADGLTYGSQLARNARHDLSTLAVAAVSALGRADGISHLELMRNATTGDFQLIEIGFRPGGGHILSPILTELLQVNLPAELVAMQQADYNETNWANLLDKCQSFWESQRAAHYGFFRPPRGILTGVTGLAEARRIPGVFYATVTAQIGSRVGFWQDSRDRVGSFVAFGRTPTELSETVEKVHEAVVFEVAVCD